MFDEEIVQRLWKPSVTTEMIVQLPPCRVYLAQKFIDIPMMLRYTLDKLIKHLNEVTDLDIKVNNEGFCTLST
jgi:hypothetical protein